MGPARRSAGASLTAGARPRAVGPRDGKFLFTPLVSRSSEEYVPDRRRNALGEGFVEQPVDSWQRKAACRGPHADVFFPPAHAERKEEKLQREERAKAICRTCSVRVECLDYAIRIHEPHGIWGGLNEMERKQLADRRAV